MYRRPRPNPRRLPGEPSVWIHACEYRLRLRAILPADAVRTAHMTRVISFTTARFDVTGEDPNPINPIAGQSVLRWLGPALSSRGCTTSEPAAEDWGWYMDVEHDLASYMVGASADVTETTGADVPVEWTVQVHLHRSMKDRLLGRNAMASDDPFCALVEQVIRAEPDIQQVDAASES